MKRGRSSSVRPLLLGGLVLALVATNVYQAVGLLRFETWGGPRADAPAPAPPRGPRPDDAWVVERYHQIYYDRGIWNDNRWMGIRTMQNPNDVWITQEIIHDVKPDYIVEAGTAEGGSAAAWATFLAQVNPAGRVITIDIEDHAAEARKLPIWQERVEFLLGSSTAPDIVAEVVRRVKDKRVLVLLDSDHRRDHVLAELKAYAPLVGVGSYVIVQDTNVNGHPVLPSFGPGPMEAVTEFLAADRRFEADRRRERMLFTMHPMGYLKRLR
jgi:cephalosporin hydroxylase